MTRTVEIIEAKLAALTAKIQDYHRNVNEGDMDMASQWDDEHIALRAEYATACEAATNDEWSLENTKARRAEFNGEILKIQAVRKVVWSDVVVIQDRLGYKDADLRIAIARHGL